MRFNAGPRAVPGEIARAHRADAVDEATAMPTPRRSRYADPASTLPVVV
jgi:hypothetical protein